MDLQNEKCVMVIDENLPLGIIANTAAIMGITLGKKMPQVVGADVMDQSGNEHLGIIESPRSHPKGFHGDNQRNQRKAISAGFSGFNCRGLF